VALVEAQLSARKAAAEAQRQATRRANRAKRPPRPALKGPAPRATFHVSAHLKAVLKQKLPARLRPYAAYFASLIMLRLVTGRADGKGFSRLLYEIMERIIPRPVLKETRKALVLHKVIAIDETFVIGKMAFGYKLLPPFDEDVQPWTCTDEALNEAIARDRARAEALLNAVQKWLRGNLARAEFCLETAREIIPTLTPKRRKRKTGKRKAGQPGKRITLAEYRRNLDLIAQAAADPALRWFTPDEYGRIHTVFTATDKRLRGCFRAPNGERLVQIDVCACQLLLIGLLNALVETSRDGKGRVLMRLVDWEYGGKEDPTTAMLALLTARRGVLAALADRNPRNPENGGQTTHPTAGRRSPHIHKTPTTAPPPPPPKTPTQE
jgi:hypothetical protein